MLCSEGRVRGGLVFSVCRNNAFSIHTAQEMLSASISQTRILQTCSMPHPNMVNGANSLQGTTTIKQQLFAPVIYATSDKTKSAVKSVVLKIPLSKDKCLASED